MDFFHCNSCYVQPGPPNNKKFWLTSCGHSFCHECINTNDQNCRICQNECKYLSLTNDVPGDLKIYFSDPIKEIKKIFQVLNFQNKHCKIYIEEYVPTLESKYLSAKMTVEKKNVEINKLSERIKKLELENEELKKKTSVMMSRRVGNSPCGTLSPPSSVESPKFQEGIFTPRSMMSNPSHKSERLGGLGRSVSQGFLSPLPSPPITERRRPLTAMELLIKNRASSLRDQRNIRTPSSTRSGQTFVMTNSSPEDELGNKTTNRPVFGTPSRSQPPTMSGYFQRSNAMTRRFF